MFEACPLLSSPTMCVNNTALASLSFDAHCYHMDTIVKHPVTDRVKASFVIFDIRAL